MSVPECARPPVTQPGASEVLAGSLALLATLLLPHRVCSAARTPLMPRQVLVLRACGRVERALRAHLGAPSTEAHPRAPSEALPTHDVRAVLHHDQCSPILESTRKCCC